MSKKEYETVQDVVNAFNGNAEKLIEKGKLLATATGQKLPTDWYWAARVIQSYPDSIIDAAGAKNE